MRKQWRPISEWTAEIQRANGGRPWFLFEPHPQGRTMFLSVYRPSNAIGFYVGPDDAKLPPAHAVV